MGDDDFVVFGQPDIRDDDIDEVVDTLRGRWIGTGPRARAFETEFARYVDAPYAVGVNSATAALHLSLLLLGVGPGDEVVVPTFTFAATANVVVHLGATPVFADVDPHTRNITGSTAREVLTGRSKALIGVHMAGYPLDYEGLEEALSHTGTKLVVDAAHGVETTYRGRRLGAAADVTAYSFYVTKNITTGEGGMLTSPHEHLADRARILSLHGLSADAWSRYSGHDARRYEVIEPGYKYNLTDMQAALGLRQLARIEASYERRRLIWGRYDHAFAGLPLELPPLPDPEFGRSALHLYSPLLDTSRVPFDRDELRERLHRRRIGTGVHFTALHLHPYYRKRFGYTGGEFPASEHLSDRTFSLPLSPGLTDAQVDQVIEGVRSTLDL